MPLLCHNVLRDTEGEIEATEWDRLRKACLEIRLRTTGTNMILFGRIQPLLTALAGAGVQTSS